MLFSDDSRSDASDLNSDWRGLRMRQILVTPVPSLHSRKWQQLCWVYCSLAGPYSAATSQRPTQQEVPSLQVCASCQKEADPRHPGSLFTAECGHTFHFECIALGLDLGHLRCPLCRKTWRRLPDTGAWANGALGFTYQGQPVKHRNGGMAALSFCVRTYPIMC
jgi:hypothetical protein